MVSKSLPLETPEAPTPHDTPTIAEQRYARLLAINEELKAEIVRLQAAIAQKSKQIESLRRTASQLRGMAEQLEENAHQFLKIT